MKDLFEEFYRLSFGSDAPTHIYCGGSVYSFIHQFAHDYLNNHNLSCTTEDLRFNGAAIISDATIPPWSAHFHNEHHPHNHRLNSFVDFIAPRTGTSPNTGSTP